MNYNSLLHDVAESAANYLDNLSARSVSASDEALERLQELHEPLPAQGASIETVQSQLNDIIAPATVATAGPRYFGFVTGGCHPAALVANWHAGAWDQNVFSHTSSPAGVSVESVALNWLVTALGLPSGTGGALVTGATMANFTALAAARHALLAGVGWDVEQDGLCGAPPIQIIVSDEVHPTLIKSLRLLGLGAKHIMRVPTDNQGRIKADQWPQKVNGPVLACLQAGNVNTGAFDPAADIIPLARAQQAWVHVDGAFGLWALATPSLADRVRSFVAADSWAVDGHKWLNVPYDCGIALLREPAALSSAVKFAAPYLPMTNVREPIHYTPDSSRRMRGLEIWAVLKSLGTVGLAGLIDRHCRQARQFAAGLSEAGFAILNDVVLNQVLVDFGSPEQTLAVIDRVQRDGICWCGPTVWQGKTAMRISISCWATEDEDIERSLEALLSAARQVGAWQKASR